MMIMYFNGLLLLVVMFIALSLIWLISLIFILNSTVKHAKYYYEHHQFGTKMSFPDVFCKSELHLSIVMPAYNESKRIEKTLDRTWKFLKEKDFMWELIVVDDGSSDNTTAVVLEWTKRNKLTTQNVRSLNYTEIHGNMGKGFAVKTGMLRARGRYVMFMDADGASNLIGIDRLLSTMRNIETDP